MSSLFQGLTQDAKVRAVIVSAFEPPNHYFRGCPFDNQGNMLLTTDETGTRAHQGFKVALNGAIICSSVTPLDHWSNGTPFDVNGFMLISNDPTSYVHQGCPFDVNGFITIAGTIIPPLFYTRYDCTNGIVPIVGGAATYTCATTSQYQPICNIRGDYMYDFDGQGHLPIPKWKPSGDFKIKASVNVRDRAGDKTVVSGEFTSDDCIIIDIRTNGTVRAFSYVGTTITSVLSVQLEYNKTSDITLEVTGNVATLTVAEASDSGIWNLDGEQSVDIIARRTAIGATPLYGSIQGIALTDNVVTSNSRFYPINDNSNIIKDTLGDGSTDGALINGDPLNWINDVSGVIRTAEIDQPRIESRGVLLGGAVTNTITHSNNMEDAEWQVALASVEPSDEISPTGTLDSTLVKLPASSGSHLMRQLVTISNGSTYTLSMYVKKDFSDYVLITSIGGRGVYQFSSDSFTIPAVGWDTYTSHDIGNGWIRLAVTSTATATATYFGCVPKNINSTAESFVADGTEAMHLWQADATTLPFPINPIYTDATAVTQAATNLTYPVPAGFDPSDFKIEVEFDLLGLSDRSYILSASDGSVNNRVLIEEDSGGVLRTVLTLGGTSSVIADSAPGVLSPNVAMMCTVTHKGGVLTTTVNGVEVSTAAAGGIGGAFTTIHVGTWSSNSFYMHGHVKSLKINNTTVV